jgi:predicted Zn-dependent protease
VIAGLIERVRPRVGAADAVLKTDETVAVTLADREVPRLARSTSTWCQLRVRHEGRVGYAGSIMPGDWGALLESALASAEAGEAEDLLLPAPAALPAVVTHQPQAAAAAPAQVVELARLLAQRLEWAGRRVDSWAERSAGTVQVANTRDVIVEYEATLVGVGARIRCEGREGTSLDLHHVSVGWPEASDLDRLASEADRRLNVPGLEASAGTGRVCLAPPAACALLRALAQGLVAGALLDGLSPLRGRVGEPVLPEGLTFTDDPLAPGRPGSRPADDEGVVSRTLPLIERGRLVGGIADLGSGLRYGVPSTGHGRRLPFAPPRPTFSNLVLSPGNASEVELLSATGDGVLLADLPSSRGSSVEGRIAVATPWAYRVVEGAVVGRLLPVMLRGNVYHMLERLVAVGREALWCGACCSPGLVLDDVELSPG